MKITLTASMIDESDEIISHLDKFNTLFNKTKRYLYSDIIKFYKQNNTNKLSSFKLNELKSSYQVIYGINSRHYNSIHDDLLGSINSILELNKSYIKDTEDSIKSLQKTIKSKQNTLNSLIKKVNAKDYIFNNIDIVNKQKLTSKLYYLKQKLLKTNNKLNKLLDIEKTGNPHLCFGSNKIFRQQFLIETNNNLTQFKSFTQWKKYWSESRNKTFVLIGSKGETAGNTNCQIKHIKDDIYRLTVNIAPKATKHKDKFISFNIKLHNDKKNLIKNILSNNISQALTYRFYKDYKSNTYKVFISLDKSYQRPKIISSKLLGAIGVDINADHLSISEVDKFGNLNKSFDIQLNLKDKTTEQSLDNIACAVKKIIDYTVSKNKPIVIEKLDFSTKRKELKNSYNKKYNAMLSSFAYSKIIELIKSRSFDKGIEVIEVNPAYTSKIGKFKYQNQYKLTTHQAASFVIARRGLLSYEKAVKLKNKDGSIKDKIITIINKEKTISFRRSKYYLFDLPVRNNQKQDNVYWKEIEQNYFKAKKHRFLSKRKKRNLILGKQDLSSETTLVTDTFGVYRDSDPNLLFMPF